MHSYVRVHVCACARCHVWNWACRTIAQDQGSRHSMGWLGAHRSCARIPMRMQMSRSASRCCRMRTWSWLHRCRPHLPHPCEAAQEEGHSVIPRGAGRRNKLGKGTHAVIGGYEHGDAPLSCGTSFHSQLGNYVAQAGTQQKLLYRRVCVVVGCGPAVIEPCVVWGTRHARWATFTVCLI